MSREISLLHPELQKKCKELIKKCKDKGIDIVISQTMRTKAEQDALYAQGRTAPGKVVTKVKYPNSMHCWGVAFDIAYMLGGEPVWNDKYYDLIGPLGESLGLEWGGRWKNFVDRPHFQLPGYSIKSLTKTYGVPENFFKSWQEEPDQGKEAVDVAGFEKKASVTYGGKKLDAGILDGKTYVEVRALAEAIGLKVGYDNSTKTVSLAK